MAQQPAAPPEEKQKQKYYNREEEYTSAQRSAVEAVHVGRETLETSVRQGEQLQNAETYADDTEYKLDRATRLLKGMTWSGWLANKFEKLVPPPDYNHHHQQSAEEEEEEGKKTDTPKVYEDVPKVCSAAAQQIQNYHANLQVLEECETEEQRATCKLICDNMYQRASKEVQALQQQLQRDTIENGDAKEFALHLYSDLNALRRCQLKIQRHARGLSTTLNDSSASQNPEREELFQGATKKSVVEQQQQQSSPVNVDASVDSQQEEHLDFMADHLDELGSLASNLNESLQRQFHTLDSLDEKSESMLFKSKMVTRRADRLVQKKVSRLY